MIISAMPGAGKSHYVKEHPKQCLDLDPSRFKGKDGVHDYDAYIEAIKDGIKKYEIVFVSAHQTIRQSMGRNDLKFYYVAYYRDMLDHVRDRVLTRDTPQDNELIASLFDQNWGHWMDTVDVGGPLEIHRLGLRQYPGDIIDKIGQKV